MTNEKLSPFQELSREVEEAAARLVGRIACAEKPPEDQAIKPADEPLGRDPEI